MDATAEGAGMRFGFACCFGLSVETLLCCSTGFPSVPLARATILYVLP